MKSMNKTVFDYDTDSSSIEEIVNTNKIGAKRNWQDSQKQNSSAFERFMMSQKNIKEDIEKHCKNKRLKKNLYKLEC